MRCTILAAAALCLAQQAPALDLRIDHPEAWADPNVSHHGKHGITGFGLGFLSYAGARLFTDSRGLAFAIGVAVPVVAGIAYEVRNERDGAYCDPVDMAWTGSWGAVGALGGYAGDRFVITPLITKDTRGIALAWEF